MAPITATTLRLAAVDLLESNGPVAWESGHRDRALALLQQFASEKLDAASLRAAFGNSSDRSMPAKPAKSVKVLPLMGVLTPHASIFEMLGYGTSLTTFARQLREAADDPSVKSIFVVVDSPGGMIGMVPELSDLFRQVRSRKPIMAAVTGLNASAAYWITSNASAIEATPSADIGAIGVYTMRASIVRQLQRDGVDVEVFSAGRYKAESLPVLPITDAERKATKERVESAYADFVGDVAAGRRVPGSVVRSGFGEGRVVKAKDALKLGMIDRVAIIEDSIARAVSQMGGLVALEDDNDRRRRLALGIKGPRSSVTDDDADQRMRLRML